MSVFLESDGNMAGLTDSNQTCGWFARMALDSEKGVEPAIGFEPTTCALQVRITSSNSS